MLDKIFKYIYKTFKVLKEINKILIFTSFFVFAISIINIFELEREFASKIGVASFVILVSLTVLNFILDASISIYESGELLKKSLDVLRKSDRIFRYSRRNRIKNRRRIYVRKNKRNKDRV